jgi:hypothetical protein
MEWTADVSAGEWIAGRLDDPGRGTVHDVVPRGFPAYARVFHPATRDRPVGRSWPADDDRAGWAAFHAVPTEVDTELVSWAGTASAFGTVMHPFAQWQRLTRFDGPYDGAMPRDDEGWRYEKPAEGRLDPNSLTALARVLSSHTGTPDDCAIALWDGWGGIVGFMGYGPSRVWLTLTGEEDSDPRHAEFLTHATRDAFNDVFRKPSWQHGILSDEVSRGPRLRLPGRDHVLFRGRIAEFADPGWPLHVPWMDPSSDSFAYIESPSIVWPADRAWILATDVDWDFTVVGGSSALVDALTAARDVEALPIPSGAYLNWDSDQINRRD